MSTDQPNNEQQPKKLRATDKEWWTEERRKAKSEQTRQNYADPVKGPKLRALQSRVQRKTWNEEKCKEHREHMGKVMSEWFDQENRRHTYAERMRRVKPWEHVEDKSESRIREVGFDERVHPEEDGPEGLNLL